MIHTLRTLLNYACVLMLGFNLIACAARTQSSGGATDLALFPASTEPTVGAKAMSFGSETFYISDSQQILGQDIAYLSLEPVTGMYKKTISKERGGRLVVERIDLNRSQLDTVKLRIEVGLNERGQRALQKFTPKNKKVAGPLTLVIDSEIVALMSRPAPASESSLTIEPKVASNAEIENTFDRILTALK